MLKVGITGGIGSGKSTVCQMFAELGIPVYDADAQAKHLMQHEHYLIDEIKKNFGPEIYEEGQLNRQLLAEKVFRDEKKLALLNSLVHPAVFRDTERWMVEQAKKNVPYVIKEAALLIESGSHKHLDKLIVVTAPLEQRVARVMNRDGSDRAQVLQRIKHQMPEEEKLKFADFVIVNENELNGLKSQVAKIHEALVQTGKK